MTVRLKETIRSIRTKNLVLILLGNIIIAFGLYNVHSVADVTEGGVLGFILLLENWFGISPAVSSSVLNALCYAFAASQLNILFLVYSGISCLMFSAVYSIMEQFPRCMPFMADMPLLAAVMGALCIGVGAALCMCANAAQSGDDALAMGINKRMGMKVNSVYLISDLTVLLLSLSYIPLRRIVYSLISVILSGYIIGIITERFYTPQ